MTLDFELKHINPPQEAILLFHGMTGSPFELKKYGQYLYSLGYDVFAYCLPGHGDLFYQIKEITCNDWLNSAFFQFEKLNTKYSKVFVGGLCLGAVLCLAIAIKYQKEVAGIICLSTTLFLDGWRLPWYRFLLPLGLNTIIRYYYSYPECEPYGIKNIKTRKIIQKLLDKSDIATDNFPMNCIYELLALSAFVQKNLYKINTPILIVHSEEDDLTSTKSAYKVYDEVHSLYKKIIILQDSYHMVLYDNEKDFVYKTTSSFIKFISEANRALKIGFTTNISEAIEYENNF